MSYAEDELEWIASNPAKKVKRPPESEPVDRFLDYSELSDVISACKKLKGKKFMSLILVLVSTGMRIGEALKFRPCDVETDYTAILARETKNKKTRRVSVYGPAREELKYWCKKTKVKEAVFGGNTKKNYQSQRLKWIAVVNYLKIEKITLHGLRHTLASYLAMSGSQLLEISKILGHSSTKMSERYSHLMDEFTKEKVKSISNNVIKQATLNPADIKTQPGE